MSVTYDVHQPARRSALRNEASRWPSGSQPGASIRPGLSYQPRNGNWRRPLRIELRAGMVGMASGNTFVKRMPCRASASMVGVRAQLSYTASARRESTITTSTFGPSGRFAKALGSRAAAAAAAAEA